MTPTPSFRDVEKLSAYLDGQLKPSEIARLETRLQTNPEFASVLKDLREARGILRQLPQRRAPRNFTLTPKMVGQKPPLPRTYPVFRFATVLATLLLFFTFATNFMVPRLKTVPYGIGGYGGGGGGGGDSESEMQMEAAPEAPAEGPAAPAEPTIAPSEKSGVQPTPTSDSFAEQTMLDEAEEAQQLVPIGVTWQILMAVIAILSGLIAFSLRYTAIRKWRAKAR